MELEWQLSVTLAMQTEWDQQLAQLSDELALKSNLLEQAKANPAEATKHVGQLEEIHICMLWDHTDIQEQHSALNAELHNLSTL